MLHEKIIIAKLRENQEVEIELFCSKGVGRTHAKWSPVSTAYYKLKPLIEFKEEIKGDLAKKLVDVCPMNVFSLKKKKVVIEDEWSCTMCRECIRDDELNSKISLGKKRNTYKFYIESVGVVRPEVLFTKSLNILTQKCDHYLKYFASMD